MIFNVSEIIEFSIVDSTISNYGELRSLLLIHII